MSYILLCISTTGYGKIKVERECHMKKKNVKKKTKKKKIKIENERSMKFALIVILIIAGIYMISPEKQKEEIKEVIPSVHETENIAITEDIKNEYESWLKEIHYGLGAISTGTLRYVSDTNKLKFLIIQLKNTTPDKTFLLKEGSEVTCISKDTANTLLPAYFATAFSDVTIPTYQEGETYTTPFQTDAGYCYQITADDLNITLPTTLKSMKLDKETNIYTLTFISDNSNAILTIMLKMINQQKLIKEISFL